MILRLILGDQLNSSHSWFQEKNQSHYLYVMMEIQSETNYVLHHHQKIVAFFCRHAKFCGRIKNQRNAGFLF